MEEGMTALFEVAQVLRNQLDDVYLADSTCMSNLSSILN